MPEPSVADIAPVPVALWLPRATVTITVTLVADFAGNREGGAARVADRAVLDLDRVAIGAVAGALLGHDQDAPGAVEIGLGGDIGAGKAGNAEMASIARAVRAEAGRMVWERVMASSCTF